MDNSMKQKIFYLALLLITAMTGCNKETENIVKCYNGNFAGLQLDDGVKSFKGIPYAQPPVGDLRWKVPLPVEASDESFDATKFGHVAVQSPDPTGGEAAASSPDKSEDCLTLNVWVSDKVLADAKAGKKPSAPVMTFIHGGAYTMGGSVDPLYNGEYIVRDNPDVIVVTMNYRLNILGFIDLRNIPGYTEEYRHTRYLGLLDQQEALRWIQRNIAAFGGDKDNVTIFGESAGAGSVSAHLTAEGSKGLFRRAIVMSGGPDLNMPQAAADYLGQAESLMAASGAKNLQELVALPQEKLIECYPYPTGKGGMFGIKYLMGNNHYPIRGKGSIIPEDPFDALEKGASKDVDLMIGTTWDEFNYFVHLFQHVLNGEMQTDTTGLHPFDHVSNWVDTYAQNAKIFCEDGGKAIEKFEKEIKSDYHDFEQTYPKFWTRVELATELYFRQGSILAAESHIKAGGNGKTYMYYFGKGVDPDAIPGQPWAGAMHACELTYAFNQANFPGGGPYDPVLTRQFSQAFVNFARTGNPSLDGLEWTEYDLNERGTMVIERDATMHMVNDPRSERRKILDPVFKTFFKNRKPF